MAKKNYTQVEKSSNIDGEQQTHQNSENAPVSAAAGGGENGAAVLEDSAVDKLRSLNEMLLNETAKKRQEISVLLEEKKLVETELTRSESELESVRAELTRVKEKLVEVEVEKDGVVKERDEIEMKKCEGELEIEKLRIEIDKGRGRFDIEKAELEMVVKGKDEEVRELKENVSLFESILGSTREEMRELNERFENVSIKLRESEEKGEEMGVENEGLRKAKVENEGKVRELEKAVCELNDVVSSLREGEEKLRVGFFELEGSTGEIVKELDRLKGEFEALLEEKKMKEREIEGLIGENSRNLERLKELGVENESGKRVYEEVLEEKRRLEEVNSRQDDEIKGLHSEVDEIRGSLLSLQEANKAQLDKNMKLVSEFDGYKSALDRVTSERDDVKRTLDEEKMNGAKLQMKVSEMSKILDETVKVVEELRDENKTVVEDKKELEIKYNNLAEENSFIAKNFVKAKEKVSELEGSLRLKSDVFSSALVMLRNNAMQMSVENQKNVEDEGIPVNAEMDPYKVQLEEIRAVFRSREEKVGEMEKQVEKLHFSVMDAKKKKSFWTLVSSATTIFAAAVSVAYATRVR